MYNIFQQLQALNPSHALHHAQITAQKNDGTLIAESSAGTVVLLYGQAKIGDHVFFNAQTHVVVKPAPALSFTHLTI